MQTDFYQIPLSKYFMNYCTVATTFRGICVYTRCMMGMPGSEVALEEVMCHVMRDMVMDGHMAKIPDNMYVGGDSIIELADNWKRFLNILGTNNLGVSAAKTKIAPVSTVILGWVWKQGTLSASPHRIATLSSCTKPVTTKNMLSFLGTYKVLARVLPKCAHILAPLEEAITDQKSKDPILWSPELTQSFEQTQKFLSASLCPVQVTSFG